ncbi:MAG: discoidin domain-containing protein, partial [Acidimicrobiia bacterium]|nr:discoidin domain-containing protein [Acidimicrobiia bacterium]
PRTVSAKPTGGAVILAGSGDGLVEAAAAGVIDGRELIRYSGALAGDGGGAAIRQAVGEDGALVITDTNRLRAQRWGSVRETEGYTERVGEKPLEPDPSDNRLPLFPGTGTASQTVVQPAGGVTARSGDYGNPVTYTPENRAGAALDDDLTTVWSVGAFSPLQGESIELAYDSPRSTDRIRLLQDNQGPQNRWIERVALRFDDGPPVEVALAQSSRTGTGQWIDIGRRRFRKLSIEILQDDVGRLSGYDGLAGVGFADIRLGDDDVRLTEAVRPPTDLLAALGPGSLDHPLAFVLTRERTDPAAALRTDEETRLVRLIDLPAARRFRVRGEARLAREATEATVDELLGIRPAREGCVDARSSRHIAGDRRARASAAIDGDPTTKWSPGFLGQADEWLSYRSARPVSFDKMDLQVVADGRHSVPTRLRIEADGKIVDRVDVPAVRDRAERNATVTLPLTLPRPVTGRDIRIVIEKVREVRTIDWISTSEVVMPVGIAELGIPGLSAPQPPARLRTGCRSDLLAVDGAPVPVRVSGSTEEALDGAALTLVGCAGPLELPAGESTLTSERGLESGLQVDRLTLSSAAGGDAATADGPIAPAPDAVPARVLDQGRWRSTVEVGPRDEPTMLVIGQSHNLGWEATLDGRSLGEPVLVDGYSSGFVLPAGTDPARVEITWAPQRVVLGALAASAAAVIACIALIVVSLRRRRRRGPADGSGATSPEAPAPLDLDLARTSPGSPPSWAATALTAAAFGVVGGL